jgi:Putative beta-barrel porin 2
MLVCAAHVAVAASTFGQGLVPQPALPDPEQTGRFRAGFIRYTPSVLLTNLGVDTNVFNELEDPKEDFTFALAPKTQFWSRLGPRALFFGSTGLDYQYFQEYDSQRSFGTSNVARVDVDLGRLTPFVEGTYTNTRIRPGFEIDTRARRENLAGRAGVSVRVSSKTRLLAWAREEQFRFDAGEEFLDVNLSYALDRDSSYLGGGAQYELTPLTTLTVDFERGEDRFVQSPERNADTYRIMPGFRFKPFALIDGKLSVGYRRFETLHPLVPDYGGFVAAVDLGYTLRSTRFAGEFNRDVTYSFENVEPYYLQNDWSLSVTQKITSTWDIVGRTGRYILDYERVGLTDATRRSDSGVRYGGGVGYTLGEYVRLGFDVNYINRESKADITRNYDGVRAGLSITYGLKTK